MSAQFDEIIRELGTLDLKNMYGKDFVLSFCQLECYTTGNGIHTVNGRRISQETFRDLYPDL